MAIYKKPVVLSTTSGENVERFHSIAQEVLAQRKFRQTKSQRNAEKKARATFNAEHRHFYLQSAGFVPQASTEGVTTLPSHSYLRSSLLREIFKKKLEASSDHNLNRVVIKGNRAARNMALEVLAESRGFCYLRLVRPRDQFKLYKTVARADPKLYKVTRHLKSGKYLRPSRGLKLTFKRKLGSIDLLHLEYQPVGEQDNFTTEQLFDELSQCAIGASDIPEGIVKRMKAAYQPSVIVPQGSIPAPSDLANFSRYGNDDLSSHPTAGTVQRVERVRADVRYIERRLEVMQPIVEAIRSTQVSGGSTGTTPPTGSSTGQGANHVPSGPGAGSSGFNSNAQWGTVRSVGTGGFPDTLEGMLARILFNQRAMMEQQGIVFQANLTQHDYDRWVSGAVIPRGNLSSTPGVVARGHTVLAPLLQPLSFSSYAIIGVIQYADGRIGIAMKDNEIVSHAVVQITQSLGRAFVQFSPTFSERNISGDANQDSRISAINQNVRTLMRQLGSGPAVVVQGTLENQLNIADVTQVLEQPVQQTLADSPMEEQLNAIDTWSVKNILSRPTRIATATWGSQMRGTELMSARFPNQWLNNLGQNTHFVNILNAYTMIKADVVFRLVVNSTSMYGGHLAMGFDFYNRLRDLAASRNTTLDLTTISNCDPIYLDVSKRTVVELRVPFSAVSQYLSRQHAPFASSTMGTVYVTTMSTLYKTENAVDVTATLYAYVEAPEVAVLQHPDSSNYVVPQASIVKTITSLAHSFLPGMKEVYPLALDEGFHVEREQTCRVEDIASVYGLIHSFQWTSSADNGAELALVYVHPMVHRQVAGPPVTRQIPRLGHLGRHYSYWNGSLEYKIVVSCSESHAGKFYVTYEPGPNYQGVAGAIETNAHALFDVQEQHELEFTVPFASPTPWKPTYLGHPFGDIASTSIGKFRLINDVAIKSALTATSNITVNIFVRAGRDFQYAVPRNGLQGASRFGDTVAQLQLTSLSARRLQNREDFNDLYKVLQRYTPLGEPLRSVSTQTVVIPVRPIIPGNLGQNSVSTLVAGFSFWRGSLSYKFKVVSISSNRAAFEIFHIPTMGIPEDMGISFARFFDRVVSTDLSGTGSFLGSQTFHADIDKEWEVTIPFYSMYDHLHLPLVHHTGGGNLQAKLPLLSTNNGCIIIRPIISSNDRTPVIFDLAVSMSCGTDFTLLAPTSFPPIPTHASSAIGRDAVVVAQSSLDDVNADEQGLRALYFDMQEAFAKLATGKFAFEHSVDRDSVAGMSAIIEETIASLCARLARNVSGWFARILPNVDWKLFASTLVGAAFLYLVQDKLSSTVGKIAIAILATTVSHKVLRKLVQYVQDFVDPQIRVQNGAGFSVQTITQLCCGVIAILLNMDFAKGVANLVKNIGNLGRALTGINSGVGAIQTFSNFVSENVVPSLSSEDALTLKSLMVDATEILEEVHTLNLEEMRVACHTQAEMKQRVLTCDGRLQDLYRLTLLNSSSPSIVAALRAAMTKMDKLRTEVMAYKGEDGYRVDPFHISVYGAPGIGKSAMMNQLNDDLISFHGLPTTNKVYTRSPENVYWDNYKGQTTTMFDDLGQIAASQPPSDLSEMISLKSNAPYMVHMASIAEKGTYFTSTFIISSTNFKLYNDCTFVKEKPALHRRRNILVEMQPTSWRGKQVADRPKVDFSAGLMGENGYAEFRVLNSLTAEPETDWMTYDEFTTLACQQSEEYLREQDELVRRQQRSTRASPAIQAIIEKRDRTNTIPGVKIGGEFVPNAEAQAELDIMVQMARNDGEDIERVETLIKQKKALWAANFDNAWFWRDYGALTASMSDLERFEIASAIKGKCAKGLSRAQQVVYNCWYQSQHLQKLSVQKLEDARAQIALVGRYFTHLYDSVPADRKKNLATALVALGALGIGYVVYAKYSNEGREIGGSNIPLDTFKVNAHPEAIQDFVEWSKANPGMIPYKALLDESNGTIEIHENPLFHDFEDYCKQQGHTRMWCLPRAAPGYRPTLAEKIANIFYPVKSEADAYQTKVRSQPRSRVIVVQSGIDDYKTKRGSTKVLVESGIDDYKTKRGMSRVLVESGIDDYKTRRGQAKVLVEHDAPNPMTLDVPEEIFSFTEEQMTAFLSQDSAPPQKQLEVVETNMAAYRVTQVDPQYSSDVECSQFVQGKLLDNMGLILHVKSGLRMRCLAINDSYIVLPKHFFLLTSANWQEGDLCKYVIRGKVYEQAYNPKNRLISPKRDLAMYITSSRVSGARSLLSQIASRDVHASYKTTDGALVSLSREKDGSIFINRHYLPVINRMTEAEKDRTVYPVGNSVHRLVGYSYAASTVNGDCGSVLVQHNVRCSAKILGFHVAAQTRYAKAFSELLVREELEEMMTRLSAQAKYVTSGSVIQSVDLAFKHGVVAQGSISRHFAHMDDKVTILGSIPKELQRRNPMKSEIKPSPLQGVIDLEPKTEPAVLDPKDPRCLSGKDPLIETVGKYGMESKPFPPRHLELITEHQVQKFRKYTGFIDKRTLTLQEAINGIPGVDYADCMNMKSAEGSFWNLSRPFWAHNKSWMFDNLAPEGAIPEYKIRMDSGLMQKLVHRLKEAREGRRVLSFSNECLKDERRPLKKTRPPPGASEEEKKSFTPGTRSFSILPVDYNILVRMYFWDFAAMIMKNRGELGPQVGIDPCSIEWTGLMKRLLATSKMGFAGDYANYDRQTPAEFMDVSCDIINGWYDDGPQNAQIRKVLMGEAYDRISLVRNAYIHIDKGLPSGFPLTTIVNSINNDTYKYCAWLALAPTELITLDKCDELTDSVYYGDDNTHAIAPKAATFFNMKTIGRFLEEHNVSLTDEHKNHWSQAEEVVPVETTTFLKRAFVKHEFSHFYLAPLEKRSIEDRLLWITDSKYQSDEELLFENIRNSLRDAFHWGPGYFVELKTKIGKALEERYPDPETQRRMMCDVTYGSEEYKWIQSCKGMDQMSVDPIMRDVFGF